MQPRKHRILLLVIAAIFIAAVAMNAFVVNTQALQVAAVATGILLVIGIGVFLAKKAKGHYR